MRAEDITTMEERAAGLAVHLLCAGISMEPLDRYTALIASQPEVPRQSAAYGRLLRGAIADLEDAAVAHGYARQAVREWRSLPVPIAVAMCEWLLDEGNAAVEDPGPT